ncbi:hypothetical protein [Burkholderia phage BCSR129]|nr:hypothetical protein [Burkholderia phage BCSR129]
MILDTFTLVYKVMAEQAKKELEGLNQAADDTGKKVEDAGKKGEKAFDGLSHKASKPKEALEKGGKNADKFEKSVDKATKALGKMGEVADKVLPGLGQAFEKAEGGGTKLLGVITKLRGPGGLGSFGAMGLMGGVVAAVGLAQAIGGIIAGVGAAHLRERYGDTRNQARAGGVTPTELLSAQLTGQRIGIRPEKMAEEMAGVKEKMMEVIMDPYSGMARAWRRRGIHVGNRRSGYKETDDVLFNQIAPTLKKIDALQGRTRATEVAIQMFGLSLDTAERLLTATKAQLDRNSTAQLMAVNAEASRLKMTEQLKNSEIETEKATANLKAKIADEATPALLQNKAAWNDLLKTLDPVATGVGKVGAALLDFATGALTKVKSLIGTARDMINNPWEAISDQVTGAYNVVSGKETVAGSAAEIERNKAERLRKVDERNRLDAEVAAREKNLSEFNALKDKLKSRDGLVSLGIAPAQADYLLNSREGKKQLADIENKGARGLMGGDLALQTMKEGNKRLEAIARTAQEIQQNTQQLVSVSLEQALSWMASGIGAQKNLSPGSKFIGTSMHEGMAIMRQLSWLSSMPGVQRSGLQLGNINKLANQASANVIRSKQDAVASAKGGDATFTMGDVIVKVDGTNATPDAIASAARDHVNDWAKTSLKRLVQANSSGFIS